MCIAHIPEHLAGELASTYPPDLAFRRKRTSALHLEAHLKGYFAREWGSPKYGAGRARISVSDTVGHQDVALAGTEPELPSPLSLNLTRSCTEVEFWKDISGVSQPHSCSVARRLYCQRDRAHA